MSYLPTDEHHFGVEDNTYTMSWWIPPSREGGFSGTGMGNRSAQRHESSHPVKPILTNSVETLQEVELQNGGEDEVEQIGCYVITPNGQATTLHLRQRTFWLKGRIGTGGELQVLTIAAVRERERTYRGRDDEA